METVTIHTPATTTNRYGDLELDWDAATDVEVTDAIVYPLTSSEDNANRSALITGLAVLIPDDDVEVPHNARVTARGETWEVNGDVADWSSPWGWDPGRQINLRRVDG